MAQSIKVLTIQAWWSKFHPQEPHKDGWRTNSTKRSSELHMHTVAHVHTYIITSKYFKKEIRIWLSLNGFLIAYKKDLNWSQQDIKLKTLL